MKKLISAFLIILTLLSSASVIISAADAAIEDAPVYEFNTNRETPTMNYDTGNKNYKGTDKYAPENKDNFVTTSKEKIELMDFRFEKYGYRLYVDEYSGEVAVENTKTGDILFTNPYDVGANSALTEAEKYELLSQIVIKYADTTQSGKEGTYYSYKDASLSGNPKLDSKNILPSQIDFKYIKNGIRMEYRIGRLDTRYLVPERISKDKFEEEILNIAIDSECTNFERNLLKNFFELKDLEKHLEKFKKDPEVLKKQREDFLEKYPMCVDGPVYIFTGATKKEYKAIEAVIKKYCPDYTYEDLDEEHAKLNYTPEDKTEPLFRVSLEYTLEEDGLVVRLPANGIRFDESIYRMISIEILPFMGAGSNPNAGYTFFPDGSGTLFDFQQLAAMGGSTYFYGTLYGEDFAYYNINTSSPHNQIVRYPVFGLKEDVVDETGAERSRGFVAVVEDGDSMLTLCSYHSPEYNSVKMQVNPRPYDEYKLSDIISVAKNSTWTVLSPRKYTGDFKIRYMMLSDPDVDKDGYETSYVGMAKAYRDYLKKNEILKPLTEKDITEDNIPLYIETFGAIKTTEKFLSIPYDTMKPLTSFNDITKMYDQLSKEGIKNVNFILTGYSEGGLSKDKAPYWIDWDGAVEQEMSFEELLKYAKSKNKKMDSKGTKVGIYPDFDFVFVGDDEWFDGLTLRSQAVETVDGRYTSKREYSATRQAYVSYFELAISPAYFKDFYTHLSEDYKSKYSEYKGDLGISVSSLGMYLTSDFDKDEPYHREDAKNFTENALSYLQTQYKKNVMTSAGNAYSWQYVNYITDIATDSSRHARSAATVPFLGIVLHGFIQTASEPINMEGNIDYAMLRAIENGSALKFILSYQNTSKLKENESTSDYYSVRYDIWKDDLITRYNKINDVLKGVQLSTIEYHEFIDGERIPDDKEIILDADADLNNSIQNEINNAATAKDELRVLYQNIRKYLYECNVKVGEGEDAVYIMDLIAAADDPEVAQPYSAAEKFNNPDIATAKDALDAANTTLTASKAKYDEKKAAYEANPEDSKAKNAYEFQKSLYEKDLNKLKEAYNAYIKVVTEAISEARVYVEKFEYATKNFSKLTEDPNNKAYHDNVIAELDAIVKALEPTYQILKAFVDAKNAEIKAAVADIEAAYPEFVQKAEDTKTEETTTPDASTDTETSTGEGAEPAPSLPVEDNKNTATDIFNRYAAAKNSVVYEIYSNGTALVLNFNDYAVKVNLNNAYYTVNAYDYIVLSWGEEAK